MERSIEESREARHLSAASHAHPGSFLAEHALGGSSRIFLFSIGSPIESHADTSRFPPVKPAVVLLVLKNAPDVGDAAPLFVSSRAQEAGKLVGSIADKVEKQAQAEEAVEKAKVAAERAMRGSWLPRTWWGGR